MNSYQLNFRSFSWRWREFLLFLFPAAIVALGFYVLETLAVAGELQVEQYWPGIALIGGMLVMHLLFSWLAPTADQTLLPVIAMMNGMGLIMIERLASNFTVRQALSMGIGMVMCVVLTLWGDGLRYANRYRYSLILPGILLLTVGLIVSFTATGPGLAVLNFSENYGIQPSEPLKLLLILFLAAFLDFHREKFATFRLNKAFQDRRWLWVYFPLLGMWGISMMLLVLQRDLGAALLFFAMFVMLAYLATERLDYVVLSLSAFAVGTVAVYNLVGHVQQRFVIWLNPWDYPDLGLQLRQSLLAVGHGGVFGQGLGQGYPGFVPVVHSDFIIAAIAEEWGLAGLFAVIALYLIFLLRGFLIAMRAVDSFDQLVAGGLTAMLCLQALIIMAGSLKLLPLTGITLPFISYGGTSIMMSYALLGILLRISRDQVQE